MHPLLKRLSAITCALLLAAVASAQLTLTYPRDRQVIQRDNNNQASVQIAGSFSVPLSRVEARFVSVQGGQTTSWATLQENPTNGQFNGNLTVTAGWYRIEVRGVQGTQIVATHQLDRFGIGEVFIVFGHSNAQGTTCNDPNECPTIEGAADDRVSAIPINTNVAENASYATYLATANPDYLPGITFGQFTTYGGTSPFQSLAWIWGRLGDLLVQRLNVPVLFYSAAFGGTNMFHMYKAMNNQPFDHGFCNWQIQMPYANVRNIMNLYVPATGVRGVLVIHGENDRLAPQEDIRTYNREVMKQCRQKFGKPNLTWAIALSSYVGGRWENVRNAQQLAVADVNADPTQARVFIGPDLDPPVGTTGSYNFRPDGLHYSPEGQRHYALLWADMLTADNNAFFRLSTPYPAEAQPLTAVACAPADSLRLTLPTGYNAYAWTSGATTQQRVAGPGTYGARIQLSDMATPASRDAMRIFFPPAVVVGSGLKTPLTPTLISSATLACGEPITLTASADGLTRWSTGATSQQITANGAGTYAVRAKHPVYGCESGPATVSIAPGAADLSLSLQAASRVARPGDTLRLITTLRNAGPCAVAGVQFRSLLPANLSVEGLDAGLSSQGGIVTANLQTLLVGQELSRSFLVRPAAAGTFVPALQITTSPVPDPDSQPNSGTGDGQDDAAQTDFRVVNSSGGPGSGFYQSANPEQVSLPPVLSNQPTPNAQKADLGLALQASNRVLRVGQLCSVTLTVTNNGGLAATGVGLRVTLPTGVAFFSADGVLSVAGDGRLTGTIPSIGSGTLVQVVFRANVTAGAGGLLQLLAEISISDQPDPDSTPGNGAQARGEDDEATAEFRLATGS